MEVDLSQYVVPRQLWPELVNVKLEPVDTERFRSTGILSGSVRSDCEQLAQTLMERSLFVVRDVRLGMDCDDLQRGIVDYLAQPYEVKHRDEVDNHQVGWTPGAPYAGAEVARNHREHFRRWLSKDRLPFTVHLPLADPERQRQLPDLKERLFLPQDAEDLPAPTKTRWPDYNRAGVVPEGLRHLDEMRKRVTKSMLAVAETLAQMLAIGLGAPEQTFVNLMKKAPHLFAPTGADMSLYEPGTVLGLAHYDFNGPFTVHLRSNCPGLIAWTADGVPFLVRVPEGCALVQAGRGLEWMTGGAIKAGFHEVVRMPEADEFIARARAEGRPAIRSTTTLFVHSASDRPLMVLPAFRTAENVALYPDTTFGEYMAQELAALGLEAA